MMIIAPQPPNRKHNVQLVYFPNPINTKDLFNLFTYKFIRVLCVYAFFLVSSLNSKMSFYLIIIMHALANSLIIARHLNSGFSSSLGWESLGFGTNGIDVSSLFSSLFLFLTAINPTLNIKYSKLWLTINGK